MPDQVPTINLGIARASDRRGGVVLVRPGTYREGIRVTADVAVLGLGQRGAAKVIAPGWEPALQWGGFKVASTKIGGTSLAATSAGAAAELCGLSFVQRNEAQQVGVYCTFGAPRVAHCDVHGSVFVAGRAASPRFEDCLVTRSRGAGFTFVDHAGGELVGCRILGNHLAAISAATTSKGKLLLRDLELQGNGPTG